MIAGSTLARPCVIFWDSYIHGCLTVLCTFTLTDRSFPMTGDVTLQKLVLIVFVGFINPGASSAVDFLDVGCSWIATLCNDISADCGRQKGENLKHPCSPLYPAVPKRQTTFAFCSDDLCQHTPERCWSAVSCCIRLPCAH